jgi:ribosomal protein S30
MRRWTEQTFDQLKALAAAGEYASVIATKLGTSHASILTMAGKHHIQINKYTPAERADLDARARERDRVKRRRKATAARIAKNPYDPKVSRTAPAFRNQLPKLDPMTKYDLERFYRQAVLNTPGASA